MADYAELRAALQGAPFFLDAHALDWVFTTWKSLPERRKLAQLFNVMATPQVPGSQVALAAEQPGAVTQFLQGDIDTALAWVRELDDQSAIGLLISSDVEGGAISLQGTTPMNNQLGMAAMADPALYHQAVRLLAREAQAYGIHWSFTPVADVNAEFRSAIVATRSFGSDVAQVARLAQTHVLAMQEAGLAATAKHWPGEGFDARDQHLVTTINPLPMAQWRQVFGAIYGGLVSAGVKTVMTGHIALPAYAREQGETGLEAFRPGSISRHLNLGLLRGELGFQGLIVSDATPMAGLSSWGPNSQVIPEVLAAGCDMVLFSANLSADLDACQAALADGRLTLHRVDEAVLRVLALKASLGLHQPARPHPPRCRADIAWGLREPDALALAERVASASPTLVKDVKGVLPLSPKRHHRVVLVQEPTAARAHFFAQPPLRLGQLLAEQGFEVRAYEPASPPNAGNADAVIFVLAQESLMTRSNIYLDWAELLGPAEQAMQRFWHELPTVLVSFGHPYYLYDAPRMPCVINAYTATEPVQRAVVRKLLGLEAFTGTSPVDARCGLEDAAY